MAKFHPQNRLGLQLLSFPYPPLVRVWQRACLHLYCELEPPGGRSCRPAARLCLGQLESVGAAAPHCISQVTSCSGEIKGKQRTRKPPVSLVWQWWQEVVWWGDWWPADSWAAGWSTRDTLPQPPSPTPVSASRRLQAPTDWRTLDLLRLSR